jgi:O-antigen ligase
MVVTGDVFSTGGRLRATAREVPAAATASALAAAAGFLLVGGHARMAYLVALAPVAVLLVLHFRLMATLLAISLPFPMSLLGSGAGVNVAGSDLALALLFAVVVVEALTGYLPDLGKTAKPALVALSPYAAWVVVLLAAHRDVSDVLQTLQRFELFLIPVLIGVAIARRRCHVLVLNAYLWTAVAFAGLYPFFSNGNGGMGAQKNPAGQFIANALILLLAVRPLRSKWSLGSVPILILGLLWTQSRGAIISVGVALLVLGLAHRGQERGRFLLMIVPFAVVTVGAFALLPQDAQQRNLDFSTTSGTDAARSADSRNQFTEEASAMLAEHPIVGVGIGNYAVGTPTVRPSTADPHNVLMLQAAEGGYPLAATFVLMVLGIAGVLFRRARTSPFAAAAAALIIASVGHGLVDVYWVRGTPVLGWLVVGMVLVQHPSASDPTPAQEREAAACAVPN